MSSKPASATSKATTERTAEYEEKEYLQEDGEESDQEGEEDCEEDLPPTISTDDSKEKPKKPSGPMKNYPYDLQRTLMNASSETDPSCDIIENLKALSEIAEKGIIAFIPYEVDRTAIRETIFHCTYFRDLIVGDVRGFKMAMLSGFRVNTDKKKNQVTRMSKNIILTLVRKKDASTILLHKNTVFYRIAKDGEDQSHDPTKNRTGHQNFLVEHFRWVHGDDLIPKGIKLLHDIATTFTQSELEQLKKYRDLVQDMVRNAFAVVQLSPIGNKVTVGSQNVKGVMQFSGVSYLNVCKSIEDLGVKVRDLFFYANSLNKEFLRIGLPKDHKAWRVFQEYMDKGEITYNMACGHVKELEMVSGAKNTPCKRGSDSSRQVVKKSRIADIPVIVPADPKTLWEEAFQFSKNDFEKCGMRDAFSRFFLEKVKDYLEAKGMSPTDECKECQLSTEPFEAFVGYLQPDQRSAMMNAIVGCAMYQVHNIWNGLQDVESDGFVSVLWSSVYDLQNSDEIITKLARVAAWMPTCAQMLMSNPVWQVLRIFMTKNTLEIVRKCPDILQSKPPGNEFFKTLQASFTNLDDARTDLRARALTMELVMCFIQAFRDVQIKPSSTMMFTYNQFYKNIEAKEKWKMPTPPDFFELQSTCTPLSANEYEILKRPDFDFKNLFIDMSFEFVSSTGDVISLTRLGGKNIIGVGPFLARKQNSDPFYISECSNYNWCVARDRARGISDELRNAAANLEKFLKKLENEIQDPDELFPILILQIRELPIETCHRLADICNYEVDNADKWESLGQVFLKENVEENELFMNFPLHKDFPKFKTKILGDREPQWTDILHFALGIENKRYVSHPTNPIWWDWDHTRNQHIPIEWNMFAVFRTGIRKALKGLQW